MAIITTNLRLTRAPGNVLLLKNLSGLEYDSVVNVSQLYTVDKTRLTDYVSTLSDTLMSEIESGLKQIMSLT